MNHSQPITYMLPEKREKGVTVMGAISTERTDTLYYILCDGSTSENVMAFMKKLMKQFEDPSEVVIVCDNAGAHKNPDMLEYITDEGVEQLRVPPHSSNLNPIEKCWSVLKYTGTSSKFL